MAATVITAPELHEETQDVINKKLLKYVPLFREHMDRGAGDLIGNLEEIIEHRLWERVGYDSFESYAREHLKHSEEWCREVVRIYNQDWTPAQREIGTVADLASAVELARGNPLSEHGGERVKQDSNTTLPDRGQTYALRRLARDRPDLLDKVEAGDLTPNAAAIEAGFRRPMKSIPVDSPENAVRALLRIFTVDELLRAVEEIADAT